MSKPRVRFCWMDPSRYGGQPMDGVWRFKTGADWSLFEAQVGRRDRPTCVAKQWWTL